MSFLSYIDQTKTESDNWSLAQAQLDDQIKRRSQLNQIWRLQNLNKSSKNSFYNDSYSSTSRVELSVERPLKYNERKQCEELAILLKAKIRIVSQIRPCKTCQTRNQKEESKNKSISQLRVNKKIYLPKNPNKISKELKRNQSYLVENLEKKPKQKQTSKRCQTFKNSFQSTEKHIPMRMSGIISPKKPQQKKFQFQGRNIKDFQQSYTYFRRTDRINF